MNKSLFKSLVFSGGLFAVLWFLPQSVSAALTVGSTTLTTDSTLGLQGGNVGVGVVTPLQLFEVGSSSAANTQLTVINTNAGSYDAQIGFSINGTSNSYTIGVDDSDGDRFKIATTALGTSDLLTLEASTGDLGIGVANPVGQLQVSDSTSISEIYITNSVTGVTAGDGFVLSMTNSDAYVYNQESSGKLIIGAYELAMTILSSGNVGINTDDATEKLDINSDNIRIRTAKSPASNATCDTGEISWDSSYFYICTATNTWKRSALTGGY